MKYHQLVKLAEEKAKKGMRVAEEEVKHLNLSQKVLHSYPSSPMFDFGEVLPHHRLVHNVELGKKMVGVVDAPMKKKLKKK